MIYCININLMKILYVESSFILSINNIFNHKNNRFYAGKI